MAETKEKREIEFLRKRLESSQNELESKIDALAEIAMELGISGSQTLLFRDTIGTILAKGVIIHKIRQLKSRVPKSKHTDKRKEGGLQPLSLPGQKELNFNELDTH